MKFAYLRNLKEGREVFRPPKPPPLILTAPLCAFDFTSSQQQNMDHTLGNEQITLIWSALDLDLI